MKAFDRAFFVSAEPNRKTMKLLKLPLQTQRYDVAAHALVYGLVKAKTDGKTRSPQRQPKRQEARILRASARWSRESWGKG
ncbi:MAG: hypothetical protein H8D32_00105 [Dehalococcoidia bacterium]|nr:hypothetical protein [Dehalococcoidia bacterium]